MRIALFVYLTIGELLFLFTCFGDAKAQWRELRSRKGRVRSAVIMFIAFNVFILLWPMAVYYSVRSVWVKK